MTGCTHRKVTTYSFVDGNEPAGMWACADCGHKFVPLSIAMERDAERYRWVRRLMNTGNGDDEAAALTCIVMETAAQMDAAIDAAQAVGPA